MPNCRLCYLCIYFKWFQRFRARFVGSVCVLVVDTSKEIRHFYGMSYKSRFHLLRTLNSGGAGRVWLAEDTEAVERRVIVKELQPHIDIDVLAREYDVLRRLSHPNVARVFDFRRESEDGPYLVEEFIDGDDIITAARELSLPDRWRLLSQVLRALEYVHVRGVIHGDIAPGNVLISSSGGSLHATLIDFGLSAHTDTALAGGGGTPGYAAPEIYRSEAISIRSDLYSFGVLAYEVLSAHTLSRGRRQCKECGPTCG